MSFEDSKLTSLNIKKYRNLENITFTELSNINIITGENNIGKTSILEAIRIISDSEVVNQIAEIVWDRDFLYTDPRWTPPVLDFFLNVFDLKDKTLKSLEIEAVDCNNQKYVINVEGKISATERERVWQTDKAMFPNYFWRVFTGNLRYESPNETINKELIIEEDTKRSIELDRKPILNISYISPKSIYTDEYISGIFSGMTTEERNLLIQAFQCFDENIIGFDICINRNLPMMKQWPEMLIEFKDAGLVPLSYVGDGLKKAVVLLSQIKNKPDILLVDEYATPHKHIHIKFLKIVHKMTKRSCYFFLIYNTIII